MNVVYVLVYKAGPCTQDVNILGIYDSYEKALVDLQQDVRDGKDKSDLEILEYPLNIHERDTE